MPQIIGGAARVVDTGVLTIDELAGNVATKSDRISIAHVKISSPTEEPWLTLHYDEWMCVLKGRLVCKLSDGKALEVLAGQTIFIEKGERFQPTFPDGDTEYIPVCLPAFRPDRCIREDAPDSDVSVKLRTLHGENGGMKKRRKTNDESHPEILYHMCQLGLWETAKSKGTAYFPPTFEADGFTHATAVPSRLIETANHFYQDVRGEWVCLRFRRSALQRLGIMMRDEQAMAVGDKEASNDFSDWICPHVIGGIPPQVVDREFPMLRDGVAYTAIEGLTDVPRRIFKLATAAEAARFHASGKVWSDLDEKDGFVHLSDRTAGPIVAKNFFARCTDLRLFEIDAERLSGTVDWVLGKMGDSAPDASAKSETTTVVHYLKPDGCVHVFGKAGITMDMVVREEAVPLGQDGVHRFPESF
jgi:uncharacterized protein (DUF952 family)/mannose-6-phosphate isomerase-like protein (cupin superfamily)